MFRFFKKKKVVEKGCKHDWVVVETGDIWVRKSFKYLHPINTSFHKERPSAPTAGYLDRSKNRVCVICGECYNGIEIYQKAYEEQERKKRHEKRDARRREALAKQMWEDGCKNAKNV